MRNRYVLLNFIMALFLIASIAVVVPAGAEDAAGQQQNQVQDLGGGGRSPFGNFQGQAPGQALEAMVNEELPKIKTGIDQFVNELAAVFQKASEKGGLFDQLISFANNFLGKLFGFAQEFANSLFKGFSNGSNSGVNEFYNNCVSGGSIIGLTDQKQFESGQSAAAPAANTPASPAAPATPSQPSANAPAANDTGAPGATKKYPARPYSETNVISNEEFNDYNYMSLTGIRNFLKKVGSQLANNIAGVDAAAAIASAAQKYKINPMVILATLQKEQSLVQTKKPITQKQLDWALGVGAYDSGNWNSKYKGFANQIASAASTFRKLYDQGTGSIKINYGARSITPANAATAAQYRYSPHTSSVKLFHSIYESYKKKYQAS